MTDAEKAAEARKIYMKKYKEANKGRIASYQREYAVAYRKNNPEKFKAYNEKYYAKLYDKQLQEEGSK